MDSPASDRQGLLRVTLSKHALETTARRGIERSDLEGAVRSPDEVYVDVRTGYLVAVKAVERKCLIVVYERRGRDEVEVVTAFTTSKGLKLARSREERGIWIRVK